MLSFSLRDVHKVVPRLTQANLLGLSIAEAIGVPIASRPSSFNVVHLSSHEGEFFYELGKGVIDARQLTRVMLHYAMSSAAVPSFEALAAEFLEYHHAVSTSSTIWRNVVAFVTGSSNDRAMKPDSMGRMPAEAIRERLIVEVAKQGVKTGHPELFGAIEADYVISMLAQVGLVVPGTSLTYRISRVVPVPNFDIYVDCVRAGSFTRILEALSTADLGLVKSQMQKKVSVSPSFIANELGSASMRASERARGTRNPLDVVNAVFYCLGSVWDVTTPSPMVASESVQQAAGFGSLLTNVAMFAAYQAQVAKAGPFQKPKYDDYVIAKEVIPLFVDAVERVSPYRERTLAEAVGHLGVQSIAEYDSAKSHMAIFESWNFSRSATAFVPVRNSRNGYGRFLLEEIAVSDQLSSVLGPIADTFGVEAFVERHLVALSSAVPGAYNVRTGGTEVMLAMPSLAAVPLPLGVTTDLLVRALREPGPFVPDSTAFTTVKHDVSDSEGMGSDTMRAAVRRGEALLHSYYVQILALAVARGGILSIGAVHTPSNVVSGQNVAIFWETTTSSKIPFGPSTLLGGRVETSEPLERIAYAQDVAPTLTITPPALPLRDHERSLHVWDWHAGSQAVAFNDRFTTTIANKAMSVQLSEVDMLSLGYHRDRLRFVVPSSARAIAEMWVSWFTTTDATLTALKGRTKDSAAIAAIEGRQLSSGVMLVQRLRAIGRSPVGQTMARLINSGLAAQLRSKGQIDAMKHLYVVPHQIRIEVWSGLVLLQLLGVVSDKEAEAVSQAISSSSALTTVMTMGLNE